ncbi:MAG: MFS transporter, partial [Bacteroidota bacterium]|nr:MFS transporter [Bacteroidota bacterium]
MLDHLQSFIRNKTARAVGLIFACCGFVFGSWASLIPYVKEKFALDEAQLGLLLLSMPMGVLFFNPVSVIFIRRYGSVLISMLAVAMMGITFMLPIVLPNIILVVVGLILGGAAFSVTNVAMNTWASTLEESSGLRIMSSCHGMWSLGAMGGALFSGLSLKPLSDCCQQTLPPQVIYVMLQALLVLLIIFLLRNHLQVISGLYVKSEDGPKMNWRSFKPGKELWMIISICLCTYLT